MRLSYANVTATLALFLALGGTSYAVTKLPKNSVTSIQVKDRSLKAVDIARGVIPRAIAGPAGAAGARGPRGDFGPTGPTGSQGPAGAAVSVEGWQALSYVNGYHDYGEGFTPGQFRRDSTGHVFLRGMVTKEGTVGDHDTIAVLPPGYRPASNSPFSVAAGQTDRNGRVDVGPSGNVGWVIGALQEKDFISLNGIDFFTD